MTKKITIVLISIMLMGVFAACKVQEDFNDKGEAISEINVFRWDLGGLTTAQRNKTPISEYFKNELGVKFKVSTAPASQWEDQFNTLINTKRIPDMFVFHGPDRPVQYKKWVNDGILLPISDYVTEKTYPNIYGVLNNANYLLNLDFANGKHYSLPVKAALCDHTLYIRTDWLKAVNAKTKLLGEPTFTTNGTRFNISGPKTMEEFYWVSKAFTEQDPDGNGKKDTYGFTTSEKNMWFINFAFYAYEEGAWNDRVRTADGNWMESWISNGSREAVKFYNRLYSENLMDKEFLDNTGDNKVEKFVNGKVGIMMHNGVSGYNQIEEKFYKINGTKEITYFAPPQGPTGLSGQRGGLGSYGFTGIKASVSAEKRKKILDLLEFLLTDEGFMLTTYGIEDVHYKKDGDSYKNLIEPSNSGEQRNIRDEDFASVLKTFVDIGDSYIYPWSKNIDILKGIEKQCNENARLYDQLSYYNGNNILTKGQGLNDFGITSYGNLIMYSGNDFDKEWSNFVSTYLSDAYGGQMVIDEYNEAYDRIIGSKNP